MRNDLRLRYDSVRVLDTIRENIFDPRCARACFYQAASVPVFAKFFGMDGQ